MLAARGMWVFKHFGPVKPPAIAITTLFGHQFADIPGVLVWMRSGKRTGLQMFLRKP